VARVLIVGCGCRGRSLAATLVTDGHAVRGTTRRPQALDEIRACGAEPALADPDRLATLLPAIEGVSAVCWLLGGVDHPPLHGPRLQSLLERLVDTPVRGLVYEGSGAAPSDLLEQGAAIVRAASQTYRMPVAVVDRDPGDHDAWLAQARGAVGGLMAV
jgi:uncharacterized protein YbjT (DUF2867 family)